MGWVVRCALGCWYWECHVNIGWWLMLGFVLMNDLWCKTLNNALLKWPPPRCFRTVALIFRWNAPLDLVFVAGHADILLQELCVHLLQRPGQRKKHYPHKNVVEMITLYIGRCIDFCLVLAMPAHCSGGGYLVLFVFAVSGKCMASPAGE